MKEFCKNHRKELAFVIFYLAYVYVACFFLYARYRDTLSPEYICFYGQTSIYAIPIWKNPVYLRNVIWYLQGFFLILAWISLINKKKWLYGLFTLIVWANFYFVVIESFHTEWWRYKWWIYNIVPVVSLILPLFYVLGKKKQGMFWISNLAVFLTACWWEIRELWVMLESACRAKVNMLAFIVYVPKEATHIFCANIYAFFKNPVYSRILHYLNINIEVVGNSISAIKRYNTEWFEMIYVMFLREKAEYCVWIDYYWFIRVFLLTGILILGIFLSYQRYNSKQKIAAT